MRPRGAAPRPGALGANIWGATPLGALKKSPTSGDPVTYAVPKGSFFCAESRQSATSRIYPEIKLCCPHQARAGLIRAADEGKARPRAGYLTLDKISDI